MRHNDLKSQKGDVMKARREDASAWRIQTQSRWQNFLESAQSSPMGLHIMALLPNFWSYCLLSVRKLEYGTQKIVPVTITSQEYNIYHHPSIGS